MTGMSASGDFWKRCRGVKYLLLMAFLATVSGCTTRMPPGAEVTSQKPAPPSGSVEDLLVVDCLLPGKVRKLGGRMVYVTPRQPVKTPAADCEIRGGEYTAYDRANYSTALKVWLEKAEQGDAAARTYVGEIYEKGLGTAPNYPLAAQWYLKAAQQGYARAQINLAHLYEKGLGVNKDQQTAINWYRKASGLTDAIALEGAGRSSKELRDLTEELERKNREIEILQKKLRDAEEKLRKSSSRAPEVGDLRREITSLTEQIKKLQEARPPSRPRLHGLPDINFGRFYALIIGNNNYTHLPKLKTARDDAKEVDKILRDRYGFKTRVLIDATAYDIISALYEFQQNLTERDNFLLYYAGHGEIDQRTDRGYWLPVDAEKGNPARWISNVTISDMLNNIAATHILVVADSCYSGTMSDLSVPRLRPGMSGELLVYTLEQMGKKRSRTVLSSGGLEPVSDVGNGKNSIFASVLLSLLKANTDILPGKDLHDDVSPRVSSRAVTLLGKKQEPVYAPFMYAGHEGGDFFFVPTKRIANEKITKKKAVASVR